MAKTFVRYCIFPKATLRQTCVTKADLVGELGLLAHSFTYFSREPTGGGINYCLQLLYTHAKRLLKHSEDQESGVVPLQGLFVDAPKRKQHKEEREVSSEC